MVVDFRDLRFRLESLDVMTIQEKRADAEYLVGGMEGESLRALALMAAKRHTVLRPSSDTKTFELLENIIVGLRSVDCVDLAKQTIAIAPDYILRTLVLASINRFNSVDQLALREVVAARASEFGEGEEFALSADELSAAQEIAAQAAELAAARERGEVVDEPVVADKNSRGRAKRAPKEKPVRGAAKAPREKKVKMTPQERAAANRAKQPVQLVKSDPNVKVKRNFWTGKPKS